MLFAKRIGFCHIAGTVGQLLVCSLVHSTLPPVARNCQASEYISATRPHFSIAPSLSSPAQSLMAFRPFNVDKHNFEQFYKYYENTMCMYTLVDTF